MRDNDLTKKNSRLFIRHLIYNNSSSVERGLEINVPVPSRSKTSHGCLVEPRGDNCVTCTKRVEVPRFIFIFKQQQLGYQLDGMVMWCSGLVRRLVITNLMLVE